MGVRGLWQVLEPTARPVLLESLRGKVLAIDASIWIYHFLKAMRDPKGTILRAAHIIGFFRRICKLLFFEIKPVFVFDGAAPMLKKLTTKRRGERRQGREMNARATANKLLTLQIQRLRNNQNQEQTRKAQNDTSGSANHVEIVNDVPDDAVYMNELAGPVSQRHNPLELNDTPFVKEDQYHLPQIDKIAPIRINDRRLLTEDELDEYAREFTTQARAGFIDTSSVDFSSAEFDRLPLTTQYQLLNTARLKSRLRMGYSSEELDRMFPSKMDFSRFQVDRVSQRNFFTQRLIKLVGMEDDLTRRVSGEKNREYMLKRNDQGWTLSLEDHSVDKAEPHIKREEEDASQSASESVDDFEDVDITTGHQGEPELPPSASATNSQDLGSVQNLETSENENTADIDALFGYEDNLARKNFYESLGDEESTRDDIRMMPGQSFLFEPAPTKNSGDTNSTSHNFDNDQPVDSTAREETEKKDARKKIIDPPWFAESKFDEEMKATERNDGTGLIAREVIDQQPHSPVGVDDRPQTPPTPSPFKIGPRVDSQSEMATQDDGSILLKDSIQPVSTAIGSHVSQEKPSTSHDPINHPQEEISKRPGSPLGNSPKAHHRSEYVDLSKDEDEHAVNTSEHREEEQAREQIGDGNLPDDHHEISKEDEVLAEDDAQAAEDEDQDIAELLIGEAEENERFAKELKPGPSHFDYDGEIKQLKGQFSGASRDADTVSGEMIQECQELLQIFGIPYVTAPTEAEAQCAELLELKLVDGIVTDDGDAFLFGDVVVYRNMFSQAKYVESYESNVIERELGLDRKHMIELALLLGSDYTDGLPGIGPVTGVEILAEFGSLSSFREWWEDAQRKPIEELGNLTSFKRRLIRNFSSKLFLPANFPDYAVCDAYLHPSVDTDTTKFTWGAPDLDTLRKFLNQTAGWDEQKVNETIVPVVQETKRRELLRRSAGTQTSLDNFYNRTRELKLGERTKKATRKLRERQGE